ncbi:putative mitochondrial carrier domain-containing protein [Neospora caninum Liverpool]|uniref:Putative mitochondrial carrier domain-containing protein n=1 Tax=Neospora caninum (strain Liverpool) TaxID=572307 RepID=F0V740_NEOCL|nr:putative mitochondrial carrier domain-containing protein [Neospora caninum Liverpool]CBZ49531.1 putative mitochondrial carrier domain-containing protein [Neospora caninum Liverpool]|eukprot:XP_003879566.1 putative mitochondrial carrier domain-containing protein [Neospora caninum Liverpool]
MAPADRNKARQQQPVSAGVRGRPSVTEVCRRIHSMWGFRGFFRGLWPCLIRVGPGTGVYFYSLDMLTGTWASFSAVSRKAAQAAPWRPASGLSVHAEKSEEPGNAAAADASRWGLRGECALETTAALVHAAAEETAGRGVLLEGEEERKVSGEIEGDLQSPMQGDSEKAPPWYNAVVSAAARGVAVVFFNPITVVKSRVESSWMTSRSSPPVRTLILEMWRTEGPASLLRGAWLTVLRDVPFSGIFFGMYTWLRTQVGMDGPREDISHFALKNFCCGASAAALASAVTHPFDVVRTRIQLYGLYVAQRNTHGAGFAAPAGSRPVSVPPQKCGSENLRGQAGPESATATRGGGARDAKGVDLTMRKMVRQMIREEGLLVLWRGLGARLAKRSLMSAMTWTSFEELRVVLAELKR